MLVDLKKTTLVDYPDHLAATLYTQGCNLLCPFCHNKSLITIGHEGLSTTLTVKDRTFLDILKTRAHLIEGVVITGGEPTLHPALFQLTEAVHQMGLKVKLDTNGCHPQVIKQLITEGLVDYIAMDVKDSPDHYNHSVGKQISIHAIEESIHLIQEAYHKGILLAEFRTTLVSPLHNLDTLHKIAQVIKGDIFWYLQCYEYSSQQLSPNAFDPIPKDELMPLLASLQEYTPHIFLRGYT